MSSTAAVSAAGSNDFVLGSSLSGSLSVAGLGWDGTDFTQMVNNLRKIEMIPTNRMLKWKADWRERQDAFRIVREQLSALRDVAAKMNTMDKFLVKNAASSNKDRATATAGSNAIENSYKLEINQVATTSIWSLSQSFVDNKTKINTTADKQTFSYEYAGTVRSIVVPPNTTLESFKNMINNDSTNPGVRASIIKGANGVTLQIKGVDQGVKNDLKIIGGGKLVGFPDPADLATHSMVYKTTIEDKDVESVNESAYTFSYSYKGSKNSISIPASKTLQETVDIINDGPPVLPAGGVNKAELVKNSETNRWEIIFSGQDKGESITVSGIKDVEKLGTPISVRNNTTTFSSGFTNLTDSVNNSGSAVTFTYSSNGVDKSITVPNGMTLEQFRDAINADLPDGMAPVTTTLKDGKYEISFTGDGRGAGLKLDTGGLDLGAETTAPNDPPGWHIQHSQNAMIRVDGFPTGEWLEVDSNNISDVVEGVTFSLVSTGECTIAVNTDAEAIQENVVQFIEAVNMFRQTVLFMTKYDENKPTLDVKNAESLYEMQKGSILTGNYGIQLLSSQLKQATAGSAKGFIPRSEEGGIISGDLYTALSQMGIKSNSTGSGGDFYGLLELNEDPKLPILSDVLAKNPQAVAEFFAAVGIGVSDSSDFSFADSMHNISRPGAYDVAYAVKADGTVDEDTCYINGKKAKYYPDSGQIGLLRQGPESSDENAVTATSDGASDFNVKINCTQMAQVASSSITSNIKKIDDPLVAPGGAGTFTYTYNGQTRSVTLNDGESLSMLIGKINYGTGNSDVIAKAVEQADKTWTMSIESKAPGAGNTLTIDSPYGFTPVGGASLSPTPTNQIGEDAEYTYSVLQPDGITYGPPQTGSSKTNTLSNIVPGVVFTLKDEGSGDVIVSGKKHNDADGIYIQVDNIVPGSYTGKVRLKQGKIPELLEMMNGTAAKPEEGMLGSKGAIQVLLDNYEKIIAGIDSKIQRETDRLTKWERTTKMRFARLEATLKNYDSLNKTIESQVKQLSGK